jgi:glycosyltransferase involved in cell wall biosynthesis
MSNAVTDSTPVVIAHVNVARGYRGGERQTELLIRALERWGVRQILVARRGGALARRLDGAGVAVRLVNGGPFGVARATEGASLVHVHEGRSVYGAYLRWLFARTPYVLTRRVNNPIGDHRLAHLAYRSAGAVAAVAPQIAAGVKAYDAAVRVEVIHSGSSALAVDEDRTAAIRAAHPGKLLVGHVGALDNAQKGQKYILTVARELERSHPDLHFMLVGGGDDEAMLKAAAAGLTNVTFTGFVDNVGDYLAAFDLFVLPSNREGIGSILFDAMDRRLPIIASSVGGVPDIVREGHNGLLIEAGRTDQLRAAILELAAAPERRRVLGERGCELARAFTAEAMARKYLALYASVLGRAP